MENLETEKKLVGMESDIKNVMSLLMDIKEEVKGLNQTYIPRSELNEMFRNRDERIKQLESEKSTKQNTAPLWVGAIFTGMSLIIMIYGLLIK